VTIMTKIAGSALLASAPAALLGCEYTATVRNNSAKTVLAELEHDRFLAETVTKRSAMLEPGDEAVLGPFKVDPLEPITLRVRIVGDVFGAWQSERLEWGDQTFVIENGTLESWEAVLIRREVD
jgi:hypothetical protein